MAGAAVPRGRRGGGGGRRRSGAGRGGWCRSGRARRYWGAYWKVVVPNSLNFFAAIATITFI
ncbi:hypothetical protein, partial [Streptomyces prunicolor]|uniref:hypothetical protein n=1 Tax=Streptomyces prunicolor TaxID=67348 RepID=UPI0033C4269F